MIYLVKIEFVYCNIVSICNMYYKEYIMVNFGLWYWIELIL